MLQTSLLLMKSLNKTETPIFSSVVRSLFPKAIFLTFILHRSELKKNTGGVVLTLVLLTSDMPCLYKQCR